MSRATHSISEPPLDRVRASRRPIVAAVGADGAPDTLRTARAIAARESRPLVIVSVVEPPPLHTLDPEQAMLVPWTIEEQLDARRLLIHDRVRELAPAPVGHDEPAVAVAYGEPTRLVPQLARERHAHLIVMGSGPHALANRVFATETALGTIRRAPCPVLALSDDADGVPRPPAIVVVAMDFSPASLHAARQALPLLSEGAVVHLVHVWRRHVPLFPVAQADGLDDAYERSLPVRFDRARKALGRERSLVFVTAAREGSAADVLLDAARDLHAELLVAGAHGHGAVERLLIGSVSTALLRGAACSVLVAPEPPPVERARLMRHMTGTSTVRLPEEWASELEAFAERNRNRRTALEIDDQSLGAQVQESGYALLGATYDRRDRHVSLMFGDPEHPEAHLTRSLSRVRSVAVSRGVSDEDGALCIESDQGSTLLTFLDRPAR
jgi:nucleotide-binding universal stress UspA family protein